MQFIVTGYDGKDDDALDRRMVARDAYLKIAKEMADNGKWLYAAAIINEKEPKVSINDSSSVSGRSSNKSHKTKK